MTVCAHVKEAIASLVKTIKEDMFIPDFLMCSSKISSGFDCGLYALAFSYSLCAGTDPAKLIYIQTELRPHFLCCLMKKELTDFPHDAIMKNPGKSLLCRCKVFCLCQLPDIRDSMVQCSKGLELFHWTCIGNEWQDNKPLPELWYCMACR